MAGGNVSHRCSLRAGQLDRSIRKKSAPAETLAKRLWGGADPCHANTGRKAQVYSGPNLGIIFLRFAEVRFTAQRAKLEKVVRCLDAVPGSTTMPLTTPSRVGSLPADWERFKQLLVLNWRQKSSARSQLKLAMEDALDGGLPRAYDKPRYEQKCSALFEQIFESYPERDAGDYSTAA